MNNEKDETIYNVPLWEKVMLTIDEAAAYTGVGSRKIRQLTDNERWLKATYQERRIC